MAIDLNATLVGINNTVTYTEGSAAISIAPTARVGMGSTIFNTDSWVQMKVAMLNPQAGDLWFIKSLPPGMSVSAISGGAPLPLPLELSIVTYPVLYLRGSPTTPDSSWQAALAALRYQDSGEVLPGEAARQIAVTGSTGTAVGPTASVTVNMVPVNDAPLAYADSGTAVEAGGINNGSLSRPASGNVLLNDIDPDNATNTLRVAGPGKANSTSGYHLHTGTNYQGLVSYQGIQQFVGSAFSDRFTRYGASGPSDTWVSVVADEGWDKVDMRSGNNQVLIGRGAVHFNLDGVVSAANMALDTVDLQALRLQGPWATDTERYNALYANRFTAENVNLVALAQPTAQAGDTASATVHVYGHTLAQDVVSAQALNGPVHVSALDNRQTRLTQGGGTSGGANLEVTLDAQVDTLIGTLGGDTFVFDKATGVRQVVGLGGDDTFRINTRGMTVTAGEGRALVELGADASGTQLNLGDGHRAQLHVKADATAQATDAVQIRLEGGARNTWVDASDATAELHVMALDGWGTIQMGGLTRVSVAQGMDRLEIQQGQHTPWKDLVLEMADASFDFNQLFTADGQQGKFLRTEVDGLRAYETRWYHASGQFTELRYVGDDLDSVEITTLNGAVRRSLDDLVASPLAQA